MPTEIRIWEVTADGSLNSIPNAQISLEEQLETWLEQDISIISSNYMVIGRQVTTDFGGVIDLLCLDSSGDIVVVELKRGKTPREVTAQALDYASWVADLSHQQVTDQQNDTMSLSPKKDTPPVALFYSPVFNTGCSLVALGEFGRN